MTTLLTGSYPNSTSTYKYFSSIPRQLKVSIQICSTTEKLKGYLLYYLLISIAYLLSPMGLYGGTGGLRKAAVPGASKEMGGVGLESSMF